MIMLLIQCNKTRRENLSFLKSLPHRLRIAGRDRKFLKIIFKIGLLIPQPPSQKLSIRGIFARNCVWETKPLKHKRRITSGYEIKDGIEVFENI